MSVYNHDHIAKFSPHRVLRGLASSVVGQVLNFLQAFVFVPLYFRAWGVAGYGRWLAIFAAVAHLGLLDLGGQSFVGNSLAQAFARGEEEQFRKKLELGLSFYFFLAGIALTILSGLLLFGPFGQLSRDDRIVALLVGAAYLFTVPGGILASCYRSTGQIVRGNSIGNIFRAVSFVSLTIALIAKIRPVPYAALFFLLWLGNLVGVFWDLRSRVPCFKYISLSWKNAKQGLGLLRGSLAFWFISISQTLNNQGFVLLVATLLGDQAVVLYATHKTASGIIGYSASLFQPAVWSELSLLAARQERERAARITLLSIKATVLFAGALSVILWFAGPVVYSVWTHHSFQVQPLLLALLVCQALLAAGWSTASWPLLAANKHDELAKWSLVNSALTLVGAAIALQLGFGIEGAALASILSDLVCGLWAFPLLAARYLDLSQTKFYLAMLRSCLAIVPAVVLARLSMQLATTKWSRLAYFGLAGLLSVIPALWVSLGKRRLMGMRAFWTTANEESLR